MQGWKQHFGPRLGPRFGCSSPVGVFCSAILLLLQPEMLSPSRTKILSGFLQAMLAPFGVKVRLSYGSVGAILGPILVILGLCGRLYGIILDHVTSAYSKTTPNYTSETLSPGALEAQQNKCKKNNQKPKSPPKREPAWQSWQYRQNVTKNPPKYTFKTLSPSGPAASTSCAAGKKKAPPSSMTMFLRK